MRTNEERIELMHQRAAQFRKEETDRRIRIVQIASVGLVLIVVILFACFMPHIAGTSVQEDVPVNMNASIFSNTKVLSFIVIAILAFLSGAAVTIFCFYLKKWRGGSE